MPNGEITAITDVICRDGSSQYPPEANRYHLYVAYPCPFAQRTMIVRELKGLQGCISMSFVDTIKKKGEAWSFKKTGDPIHLRADLREVYLQSHPEYKGRFSVPVLYDKKTNKIVSNDSGEIIKMLNSEFNSFCHTEEQKQLDLYPQRLRKEIDKLTEWIQTTINEGVYALPHAKNQKEFDTAFWELFKNLDEVEDILKWSRYLAGSKLTLADIRLFPTLVRFDLVYNGLYMANLKRIHDYPDMSNYLKELYQMPAFKGTTHLGPIKEGYYLGFSEQLNPSLIVPPGPLLDLDSFHNRLRL